MGYMMGTVTNLAPASGGARDNYAPTDAEDYNLALRNADNLFIAAGMMATIDGGSKIVGGGAVASAAPLVAATGVGAVVATEVAVTGGAIALQGVAEVVAGIYLMSNAKNNAGKGSDRGPVRNPNGSKGKPDHQRKVNELND